MTITFIKKAEVGEVFIDKISVVLDIPTTEQWDVENSLKSLLPNEGYQVYRPLYKYTARLCLEYPDVYAEVSIQPKFSGISYMRVELNPAQGYIGYFSVLMDKILPGGYLQLIAHGRCTRIDAAVDVVGVNINSLLVTYPKMRRTKGFYNNGKLETYTLGVKQGKTEICVYDKASQIKYLNATHHLKLEVPNKTITRIEVRSRKGRPLKHLAKAPNFFKEVLIASYFSLDGVKPSINNLDNEMFNLFLEVCRSRGAQDALKMISEPTRGKYKGRIENCKLPWWQPTEIWKGWHIPVNALLHPTHLGD
jgi:hypothetical protein